MLSGSNLSGDVSNVANAVTVNTVGGSTAANIHSAELAANAATNLNTASTIVKRDASGNFVAGAITANLTGAVTGNATTATTATNIAGGGAGQLPYQSGAGATAMLSAGSGGQVLQSLGGRYVLVSGPLLLNQLGGGCDTPNFSAENGHF